MLKSDFYYDLPEELIAQTPAEPRDSSRLMVLERESGDINHGAFYSLSDYLNSGDLLVMNNSKVFPARILGVKRGTDIAVEFLLLEDKTRNGEIIWETMVCPGRRLKKGAVVDFAESVTAVVLETLDGGNRLVKFSYNGDFYKLLNKIGNMPLPPYITAELRDNSRYNTVYAEETGSAAAPTAGLHFTERVFASIAEKGIETANLTLHVGIGTFRPVKCDRVEDHKMHSERFFLPNETVRKIRECKSRNNRVIAVGTTSCRVLEANKDLIVSNNINGELNNNGGFWSDTDIFITPGYKFGVVDALLTNYHLPESTLLMLVSAFAGRDTMLNAYQTAINEKYRFFSFGDSMLIL